MKRADNQIKDMMLGVSRNALLEFSQLMASAKFSSNNADYGTRIALHRGFRLLFCAAST
jgi:hypothetical protein